MRAAGLRWSLLVACACANARRRPALFVRVSEPWRCGAARTALRGAGADNATTALAVVTLASEAKDADGGDGPAIVAGAVRALPNLRRLFVAFDECGGSASPPDSGETAAAAAQRPTDAVLRALARVFDAAADADRPCLDVVPLFACAGWRVHAGAADADGATLGSDVALLDGIDAMIGARGDAWARAANARRADAGLSAAPLVAVTPAPRGVRARADAEEGTASADVGPPLEFLEAAVGGTFDRLHAGHRLLLAASALVSTRRLHIGIAGAALLEGKVRVRELMDRGAPARPFALSRGRPFPGPVLRDEGSDAKRVSDVRACNASRHASMVRGTELLRDP